MTSSFGGGGGGGDGGGCEMDAMMALSNRTSTDDNIHPIGQELCFIAKRVRTALRLNATDDDDDDESTATTGGAMVRALVESALVRDRDHALAIANQMMGAGLVEVAPPPLQLQHHDDDNDDDDSAAAVDYVADSDAVWYRFTERVVMPRVHRPMVRAMCPRIRSKSVTLQEIQADVGIALTELRLELQMLDLRQQQQLHTMLTTLHQMKAVVPQVPANDDLLAETHALIGTIEDRVHDAEVACDLGGVRLREMAADAEMKIDASVHRRRRTAPAAATAARLSSVPPLSTREIDVDGMMMIDEEDGEGLASAADVVVVAASASATTTTTTTTASTATTTPATTSTAGAASSTSTAVKTTRVGFVNAEAGDVEQTAALRATASTASSASSPSPHASMQRESRLMQRQQKMVDVLETMRDAEKAREAIKHFGDHNVKLVRMRTERTMQRSTPVWFRIPHLLTKPRLRQYWLSDETVLVREDKEHKVSWNELFFDLVFVVTFSDLGHSLQSHSNIGGVLEFLVLFSAVWRIWSACNTYINRFDPSDATHKLFYFLEMLLVMSIVVHGPKGQAVSFLLAKLIPELLTEWSAQFERKIRRLVYMEHLVYVAVFVPWFLSIVLDFHYDDTRPDTQHLVLWSVGLFVDVFGQAILANTRGLRLPLNIEHCAERFGLFTLIMMGEQLISLVFKRSEGTHSTYLAAICAGVVVLCFQIFYFDVDAGAQKQHALFRRYFGFLWYFGHLPLHASITMGAAATNNLIEDTFKDTTGGTMSTMAITSSTAQYMAAAAATTGGTSAADTSLSFDRWLFGTSQCISYVLLAALGASHISLATLVPKRVRIGVRLMCGFIMIIMPLVGVSPVGMLSVAALCSLIAGTLELYGGVVPRVLVHKFGKAARGGSIVSRNQSTIASTISDGGGGGGGGGGGVDDGGLANR